MDKRLKSSEREAFRLIEEMLELMESRGLVELEMEHQGLRIRLKKAAANPAPQVVEYVAGIPQPVAPAAARPAEESHRIVIKSPMVGTFYRAGDTFHLMDTKTYEEVPVAVASLGPAVGFLKENMELEGQFHDGQIIGIQPPMFVEVHVESTEPGVRGDTSKGGMKPATLETGATIQVPLFVETGDLIRVDTRSASYVSRV